MESLVTELARLVEEYHHVQAEYRLAGVESAARRHVRSRLDELEQQFEHLLKHSLADEKERNEWRRSLHHRWPSPPPHAQRPPLLFKGRSEAGSLVEIHSGAQGKAEADVVVDGVLVERLAGEIQGEVIVVDDRTFRETFGASPEALRELRAWAAAPAGQPPWLHAPELFEDGLIDRHFGLTARGRRALRPAEA